MKFNPYNLRFKVLLFIFLAQSNLWAQEERLINKTFSVNDQTLIEIKNTFGTIHVTSWDEPQVEVKVEIAVRAERDSRLAYLMENLDVRFSQEEYRLMMRTETDVKTKGDESFKVNYRIKVPRKNKLEIGNSFGDIFIDDRLEPVEIDLAYGDLKAGDFTKGGELNVSFGKVEIGHFETGTLKLRYCDFFSLESASFLDLDQQFSDIEVNKVQDLQLESKYGSLEIGWLGEVVGDVKFTEVDIDWLDKSLKLDCQHTSNFTIAGVSKHMELIDIDGGFGSYDIDLEEGLSADFSADFEYADLRTYGVDVDYSVRIKEDHRRRYRGRIGKGESRARIIIFSDYGDVRLSQ